MHYFSDCLKNVCTQILNYPITVIEADSGYGKSTAVNEFFLKQVASEYRKIHYICLEESPESTWKGICRELEKIDAQVGRYLYLLSAADPEMTGSIASQMRYLTCSEPTIFCLDNFQLFSIPHKYRLLEALAVHGCDLLHIVVLTQPGHRRSREICFQRFPFYYISADDLRFNRKDIREFFHQEGLHLQKEDLETLWSITEGYVAALLLQLDSRKRNNTFQDSKHVSTLMERVFWRNLESQEQEAFLRLSVLDTFSLKQGAEIVSDIMTADTLQYVMETTDFVRYDNQNRQYMFHHLMLVFLREKFCSLTQERQREIWERAAHMEKRSGNHLLAAHFYGKCKDYEAIEELTFDGDDRVELVHMEEGSLVREMIASPQKELLGRNPELLLILTLELYMQGELNLFQQYLEETKIVLNKVFDYGEKRAARLLGEYALMESFFAFNDVKKMCGFHRRAWEFLKGPTSLYSFHTAWTFGIPSVVCMFWRKAGTLCTVLKELQAGMPLYYKLSGGNGRGAHSAMEGEIALLKGDDKSAEAAYGQAIYDAEEFHQDSICYCVYFGRARIAILRGQMPTYTHMQEKIDDRPYFSSEARSIFTTDVCKGYLYALLEQFENVPGWLWSEEEIQKRALMLSLPFVHAVYGRLMLEQLRDHRISYEKFEEKLLRFIEEGQRFSMLLPQVYDNIYLAVGMDMSGRQSEALERLQMALQMTYRDKVYIPFAENYILIRRLSERLVIPSVMREAWQEIVCLGKRFEKGRSSILAALYVSDKVLTVREKEIARLLKARHSVKEIAIELSISASTVSNTMQNIYGKLGIHSKRELYFREDIN